MHLHISERNREIMTLRGVFTARRHLSKIGTLFFVAEAYDDVQ